MKTAKLFSPLKVGALTLPNRVFMAPLTRLRSIEPGDIPTPLMAEYYRQRASAGLIVTEATQISFQAKGYAGAPGLHTQEQLNAWKKITQAVHDEGGHIAVQLWHVGRISHNTLQPGQQAPVAPSAIAADTRTTIRDETGAWVRVPCSTPRALETEEIPGIINDFRQATANAREAGFDYIELHAAHGYLLHQFMSPASNQRTDQYGGSIENRTRLTLEEAALYLIDELNKRHIAYLHISEPDWAGGKPYSDAFRDAVRARFQGVIVGAGAYTAEKAEYLIEKGFIDAVAFGRSYISNPDLVARLQQQAPLNEPDGDTFYGGGAKGYTDYPTL